MNDLNDLERRIKEKLALSEERKQLQEDHHQKLMLEFERRHQQFTAAADRLMANVLNPRMHKLAECFDNAVVSESGRHHGVCTFNHTVRFPAQVKLELAISRDGLCETFLVLYHLEILPVFFPFQAQDKLSMPLERVNDDQVTAWVHRKLIEFVDTYFQLETVDQYQSDNLGTDPVCGMRVNKAYAPAKMIYQGQTYYFCCRSAKRNSRRNRRITWRLGA